MAMFDDTNFDDELAGLDDLLKDYEPTDLDELHQEKPKRKAEVVAKRPAARKDLADEMSDMLLDEDEDEDEFSDDDEEDVLPKAPKPQKEKGVGGLIALCVAETVAIIGLLAWWFLCLR